MIVERLQLARVAYEAYSAHAGFASVRGKPLPSWDRQREEIKDHWRHAVQAVVDEIQKDS